MVIPLEEKQHRLLSRLRKLAAFLLVLGVLADCRTGRNYPSSEGPRYAGHPKAPDPGAIRDTTTLRVISFNIEFALHVDSAIAVLASNPALRDADVLLLQEMDEKATRRIGDSLHLWYVYYPAIFHLRTHRLFGNAVLSHWPIVEDQKIVLPHVSRFVRTQRTATAATIRVGQSLIRVYSTHLGTMTDVAPAARGDQLRAIIADAARYSRVVIGGDMNDPAVGHIAREMGYSWPTQRGPSTSLLGRLDHIFLRGLGSPDTAAAGTVLDVGSASDHLAVWAVGILRQ
jgi:endonuclease/exonuclease/phosphatase family metal-dependent hydrolase